MNAIPIAIALLVVMSLAATVAAKRRTVANTGVDTSVGSPTDRYERALITGGPVRVAETAMVTMLEDGRLALAGGRASVRHSGAPPGPEADLLGLFENDESMDAGDLRRRLAGSVSVERLTHVLTAKGLLWQRACWLRWRRAARLNLLVALLSVPVVGAVAAAGFGEFADGGYAVLILSGIVCVAASPVALTLLAGSPVTPAGRLAAYRLGRSSDKRRSVPDRVAVRGVAAVSDDAHCRRLSRAFGLSGRGQGSSSSTSADAGGAPAAAVWCGSEGSGGVDSGSSSSCGSSSSSCGGGGCGSS
ncbi:MULTISPECIES: TIGR04222 domain-containing membrane protein [unclassified Streptomyces]|uniref:TIGR04222 domain-containing membrane protein n=1 Tax=unclassified Streptomyces TaxID=2593676 RepID=UPI000CD58330|nr:MULTISPECIES: TIGR04222 domain-containing membrane protein [unclassified Streptomyces]